MRNRPAPVSTVVAIDKTEQDQNYINQFLKEINTIEQINLRSDKFIEEKAIQTYMLSNDNGVTGIQLADPTRMPVALS